jgi:hypothetical protein
MAHTSYAQCEALRCLNQCALQKYAKTHVYFMDWERSRYSDWLRAERLRVPVWARLFTSSRRPDRFWGPPRLLSNEYRALFPEGKAAGVWSYSLPPTSQEVKNMWIYTYIHSPIIHSVVVNEFSTGTTLPSPFNMTSISSRRMSCHMRSKL